MSAKSVNSVRLVIKTIELACPKAGTGGRQVTLLKSRTVI